MDWACTGVGTTNALLVRLVCKTRDRGSSEKVFITCVVVGISEPGRNVNESAFISRGRDNFRYIFSIARFGGGGVSGFALKFGEILSDLLC